MSWTTLGSALRPLFRFLYDILFTHTVYKSNIMYDDWSIALSDFIAFLDPWDRKYKEEWESKRKEKEEGRCWKKSDIFRKRKKRDDGTRNRGKIPPTAPPISAPLRGMKERRGEHKTHFNWQCQTDKDGENEKFNCNCSSTRSVRISLSRDTEMG